MSWHVLDGRVRFKVAAKVMPKLSLCAPVPNRISETEFWVK